MIDFLTHMPANTVIFITMAVLGLVGMLILLRAADLGLEYLVTDTSAYDCPKKRS